MGKRFWVTFRRFLTTTLALFSVAVLLLLLGYFAVAALLGGDEIATPNVIGQESGAALEILLTAGLRPKLPIEESYSDEIPQGHIMEQSPLPGSRVKKGRGIRLVKSLGSQKMLIPTLVGLDLRGAEWQLNRSQLQLGRVLQVHHDEVPDGVIITQDPLPNTRLSAGSSVSLLISRGPAPRFLIVPHVRGRPLEQVRNELRQLGFQNIREQAVEAPQQSSGRVLGQQPRAGVAWPPDQEITLLTSGRAGTQGNVRYRYFSYSLPPALGPGKTEVQLQDDSGLRKVYDGVLKKGGRLEFIERTVGNVLVVIYQDGLKVMDDFVSAED